MHGLVQYSDCAILIGHGSEAFITTGRQLAGPRDLIEGSISCGWMAVSVWVAGLFSIPSYFHWEMSQLWKPDHPFLSNTTLHSRFKLTLIRSFSAPGLSGSKWNIPRKRLFKGSNVLLSNMTSKATKSVEHHSLATPVTTAPPRPKHSTPIVPSRYRVLELLRRQQSCSYGKCGNDCLPQGSFCCNPAGAAFDVPRWVCGQ